MRVFWEECVLVGAWSASDNWGVLFLGFCLAQVSLMLSWLGSTVLLDERNTSISMSQRSRASSPSMRNPASREVISDSVELCETEVCFLHIQLMGTNVRLPKIHKTPPDIDFESSRSPAKSESWNKPNLQCWAVLPTWQYSRNSFVWWMYEINLASSLSPPVHFGDWSSKFVHWWTSGLPIRARYKHVKTMCEQTADNSPTDSSSSCMNWWSSKKGLETL